MESSKGTASPTFLFVNPNPNIRFTVSGSSLVLTSIEAQAATSRLSEEQPSTVLETREIGSNVETQQDTSTRPYLREIKSAKHFSLEMVTDTGIIHGMGAPLRSKIMKRAEYCLQLIHEISTYLSLDFSDLHQHVCRFNGELHQLLKLTAQLTTFNDGSIICKNATSVMKQKLCGKDMNELLTVINDNEVRSLKSTSNDIFKRNLDKILCLITLTWNAQN